MRLIDADALRAWLKTIPLKDLSDGLGLCRVIMEDDFKRAIKNMPNGCIVDAEPVIHGHWDSNGCCTSCGECAARTEWDTPVYDHWNGISRLSHFDHHVDTVKTNYCPNCGAKMDEEDNT